jgi:predicted alpha/beta superfamily hydrolase
MSATGQRSSAEDFNGLQTFLRTIEVDIKPRVEALVPIDRTNQTLFGYSLGGLAVIEALFTAPTAFRGFVAASPSIWWSSRAVLAGEPGFSDAVTAAKVTPRVLLTVGGDEQRLPDLPPALADKRAAIAESIDSARMIDNCTELAARLKALRGAPGYEVTGCLTFPGQAHGISAWPAIGQAIEFTIKP